jgi:serine protease AprX
VPKFAQHGTNARPVDVIAPATHVLGLRVPGSFIDTLAGNTGQVGSRFQRGSGTSQATALASGVVALLVQRFPWATPDQLKALVTSTAVAPSKCRNTFTDPKARLYCGHGVVNADRAIASFPLPALQLGPASLGTGTLDASRGGVYVTAGGIALTGQKDIFGRPFSSAAMATAQSEARSWTGGWWNGSRWTGDGWTGDTGAASTWAGADWAGRTWAGADWAGRTWAGSRWSGMNWDGSRWTGSGWHGSRWTGSSWDGSRWSGSTWH